VILVVEALHSAIPTAVGEAVARGYEDDRRVALPAEEQCYLADRIRLGRQVGHGTRRAHVSGQPRVALGSPREAVECSASRSDAPRCRNRTRDDLARTRFAAEKGMGQGIKHWHGGRIRGPDGHGEYAGGLQPAGRKARFRGPLTVQGRNSLRCGRKVSSRRRRRSAAKVSATEPCRQRSSDFLRPRDHG
jgi:hypothetical protein